MPLKQPQSLRANLDVLAFRSTHVDFEWIRCQSCDGLLRLMQPDELSPYHLLGVCEDCRGLSLILMNENLDDAIMIVLQTTEWYRSIAQTQGLEENS